MIAKFFAKNTVVTSETIRVEIGRTQREISSLHRKLDGVMAGVATMTDAEHIAAEADVAAIKRSIVRLEARADHLVSELPKVLAAEESAAKVAADESLRLRAEASRKANSKEAATLLRDYDKLAAELSNVLARLGAIADERNAVNEALRASPVAEGIVGYDDLHRKQADRTESAVTERRKCWVYKYPASPPDQPGDSGLKFVREAAREEVHEATIGPNGTAIPVLPVLHDYYGRAITITPTLEEREIVVGRNSFRPGFRENPLSAIHLPPGFAGGNAHWPRKP